MVKKRAKMFSGNYRFYVCAVLILMIGCQNQPKKIMNDDPITNTSSPSEPVSIPELEKFIFKADSFNKGVVPRKLDPAEVAKFLLEKINAETEFKHWVQVEKVANFYDSVEVAEKFKGFLNKSESGEEGVRRSIVIARIVGSVGKPEDVEAAKQYYVYLISKVNSLVEFKDIILLHDVLRLGKNSAPLRAKIQERIKSLETKQEFDEEAETEYDEFQGKIEQELTRVEQAASIKNQILGSADRKQRMEEEIKAYLGIDYGFLEYLQKWSAARLRRETWGKEPSEQIMRNVRPQLRADVVKTLREFFGKLDKMPDLEDDEDKEAAQVQILRAIKFFEGEISEQEENFLAQYKGKQADILANEGFQIP